MSLWSRGLNRGCRRNDGEKESPSRVTLQNPGQLTMDPTVHDELSGSVLDGGSEAPDSE
jgi:hypothetical protein